MDDNTLIIYTTIGVALISLIGNLLQFILAPRTPKTKDELDLSQTLRTITEAYDKLFTNLRLEIQGFEEELKVQNGVIEELTRVKILLEQRAAEQEQQLLQQRKEIDKLKRQLGELRKVKPSKTQ